MEKKTCKKKRSREKKIIFSHSLAPNSHHRRRRSHLSRVSFFHPLFASSHAEARVLARDGHRESRERSSGRNARRKRKHHHLRTSDRPFRFSLDLFDLFNLDLHPKNTKKKWPPRRNRPPPSPCAPSRGASSSLRIRGKGRQLLLPRSLVLRRGDSGRQAAARPPPPPLLPPLLLPPLLLKSTPLSPLQQRTRSAPSTSTASSGPASTPRGWSAGSARSGWGWSRRKR